MRTIWATRRLIGRIEMECIGGVGRSFPGPGAGQGGGTEREAVSLDGNRSIGQEAIIVWSHRWLSNTASLLAVPQGLGGSVPSDRPTSALAGRAVPVCVMLKVDMRDADIIETELMEISAMADDGVKLERIIAWCAVHPDEVPFALHHLMRRRDQHDAAPPETPPQP